MFDMHILIFEIYIEGGTLKYITIKTKKNKQSRYIEKLH